MKRKNDNPPVDRPQNTEAEPRLHHYAKKRDFAVTPEPSGHPSMSATPLSQPTASAGQALQFVVQKHHARRLHYDFRLEAEGVLKSWAVPKGPSLDPSVRRLAVMVEDHPLDYAGFEGTIPAGEYGAGEVIVWDRGDYEVKRNGAVVESQEQAEAAVVEGIAEGEIKFILHGSKLRGEWVMVRTSSDADKERMIGEETSHRSSPWLLIKKQDEHAKPSSLYDVTEDTRSVLSGPVINALEPTTIPGAKAARIRPASLEPMLATLTDQAFSGDEWSFEPKLDGMRALAYVKEGKVSLFSRRGQDATRLFPGLCSTLAQSLASGISEVLLDGEIVAPDAMGVPSFQRLQQRINLTRPADIERAESAVPVLYYLFDAVYLNGYDLRAVSLVHRRAVLTQVVRQPMPASNPVRMVFHWERDGEIAYRAAVEHGFEGIVAKRLDSPYESGKRSRRWLKVKATRSDDFVIGGYTTGTGRRGDTFGALLLGQFGSDGKLNFTGHVGTGFDDATLQSLLGRLRPLHIEESPFATPPATGKPTQWVRPELVAEIKYMERTRGGILRAPVFVSLREDKAPKEATSVHAEPESRSSREEGTARPDHGDDLRDALGQIEGALNDAGQSVVLKCPEGEVPVTNLDKVLWPEQGARRPLTKRDLLLYYARVSPYLLPHLKDRPITLTRYPNGITGKHFYQRHWDRTPPTFVQTVTAYSRHNEADGEYLLCNNLATLLWLGQLADIELHTWFSRVSPEPDGHHLSDSFTGGADNIASSLLNYPDYIAFDLDPYVYSGEEKPGEEPAFNRKGFRQACDVALLLRDLLARLSLSAFLKTSGKTGLHIYVPVLRDFTFNATRAACETLCRYVEKGYRDIVTMEWSTSRRTGKIFLDHNMNARSKTIASVYSPRAGVHAGVSMPVRWEELPTLDPREFSLSTTMDRLSEVGDLWERILASKHDLSALVDTTSAHPTPH